MVFAESKVEHPNILKTLGGGKNTLHGKERSVRDNLFVVTELAENGELFDFLFENGGFEPPMARQIF